MRTLFLLLVLTAPAALAAQPAHQAAGLYTYAAPGPDRLVGTYTADGVWLHVARTGRQLVLTLAGQAAFDTFAEAPADPALGDRAERLLRDAFAGNAALLAAAFPPHRTARGTRDVTRMLALFTDAYGPLRELRALGTLADGDHASTFVRVRFEHGEELLRLKWKGDRLALVTRGMLPQVEARQIGGEAGRYAVDTPPVVVAFDGERVKARGAEGTFEAARR